VTTAKEINASDFGEFVWGTATSAYQIEGAAREDGKSPSIWDTFAHRRGKVRNRDTGDIACDHYHRFPADIQIIKSLGISAYRFSLAWTRIQPEPSGTVNPKGVDHYDRLIDKLLESNITPYATLYHWDLPQYLQDAGGWAGRDIVERFRDYAETCARAFGDRLKHIIVLNEPMIFLTLGYLLGLHAPGKRSMKKFFAASHHALLAQAEAARCFRLLVPDAQIGTTISTTAAYPASNSPRDQLAAARFDILYNTFYLDPVVGRGYPTGHFPVLRKIEKHIRSGDMEKLQFDFDFWGINTYTRKQVRYSRVIPYIRWRELKNPSGAEVTAMNWEVYPQGIYDLLMKFSEYKEIKKLYITENGAAFDDQLVAGRVVDTQRVNYFRNYISQVLAAKQAGANVAGYFAWSLLDNFEWAEGYAARFGLVHVDYSTQKRTVKDSGLWYRDFLSR
jgi:beta-glucosidase